MESASISVVIPTYNRAALVPRAVESALAAMQPGDEILVIDDGSTDDTESALAPYLDRIQYIRTPQRGVGAARNRGIRESRRPLIAFLDSDDEWMRDKLVLQRAVMRARPDVVFACSDFTHRDVDGTERRHEIERWVGKSRPWDVVPGTVRRFSSLDALPTGRGDFDVRIGDLYASQMSGDFVCPSTAVVRAAVAGPRWVFPEDVAMFEDWECFGRLARLAPVAYLDSELACNIDHGGPRMTQAQTLLRATSRITILERLWGVDAEFLQLHGDLYRKRLMHEHLLAARGLLVEGRTREARLALRRAGGGPLSHRLLAALPPRVVRRLVVAYHRRQAQAANGVVASDAHHREPGRVRRLVRMRREHGWSHALYRAGCGLLRFVPRRLVNIEVAEILSARTTEVRQVPRLPRALCVRLATVNDLPSLGALAPSKAALRLARGDRCLIEMSEAQIHATEWIQLGPAAYDEDRPRLGVRFRVPARACWLYDGRTTGDERTIGPWGAVMGRLRAHLETMGADAVYLQVSYANPYSMHCHRTLGFRVVGRIACVQLLGLRVVWARDDTGRWIRVREGELDLARFAASAAAVPAPSRGGSERSRVPLLLPEDDGAFLPELEGVTLHPAAGEALPASVPRGASIAPDPHESASPSLRP